MSIKRNFKKEKALQLAINLLEKGTDKYLTARATGLDMRKINELKR